MRSRHILKTTSNANTHDDYLIEVDALSRIGTKGKGKFGKGKKGGKKCKGSHAGNSRTWAPASSPQPSRSQVNTIREVGHADEVQWIFSLEDSTTHRQVVDHELMVDPDVSGMSIHHVSHYNSQ